MVRWLSRIRMAALGLALACPAPAMAADPFVLFLLRMLRDQAISSSIEAGIGAAQRPSSPGGAATAPGFGMPPPTSESQQLKAMIDESFVHLRAQQREELHASLMRILDDPRNAASRGAILSEFNAQALALRNSHRMLSQLSEADMKIVAASARTEYARLPVEQRQQLLQALQHGVPGMPRALHDLMLAEFNSVTR